jgi:hypothetical protein
MQRIANPSTPVRFRPEPPLGRIMVKGYGNRKAGTYRSGFGDGIFLHVAKDGTSTWHVRFKLDGKDVSRRVEAS